MLFDRPFRKQIGWLIGLCLLIMATTASIGWTMRTQDLSLVESKGVPTVRAMQTADSQLYWAATNPQDEASWIAVKDYSGATDEMKARARAALGLIYLKTNRRALAETAFNDLVAEPKFKADGLAGLALLAGLNKDSDSARKLIRQIDSMEVKLFPEVDGPFKDLHQRLSPAN